MMQSTNNRHILSVDDGTEISCYVSLPANPGPRPAILVLQEALGVNSQIRRLADRYASLGFVAIAPDLFHRVSPGFERTELNMDEVMPLIRSLTTDGLIADLRATLGWLTSLPNVDSDRIASVGFCMGGRASYLANSALPIAAAISYYGGSIAPGLLDRAASMHGPHLFFWGGLDRGIPPEQHRAVADALRAAGKQFVDVEFSDCNHGFFNEQWTERYNESAARQSWAMGIAFLEDTLNVKLAAHA
jgi:carboxymethylenebutenolidase